MIDSTELARLYRHLPFLADPAAHVWAEALCASASLIRIPAGHRVFSEGDTTSAIAILLSGRVRVYKIAENGREITLYRFGHGESCILTANAILSQRTFPATAMVEEDSEALMIPAPAFRDWVRRADVWREFVFELLSQRLASVMALVDEVAFRRMDQRLALMLSRRCEHTRSVRVTHQALGAELGTSREVVSRILEDFAHQGVVRLGRGEIEVPDRDALLRIVA